MACSHDGSIQLAKRIINGAGKSNADAIQLQIWSVKVMMTPDRSEFKILSKIEFSFKTWQSIIDYSKKKFPKMKVLVCVYENGTIDQIKKLKKVDGYKINSSDLSNNQLLVEIGKTNKLIHLSVGASTIEEISSAIKLLKNIAKNGDVEYFWFPMTKMIYENNLNYALLNNIEPGYGLLINNT